MVDESINRKDEPCDNAILLSWLFMLIATFNVLGDWLGLLMIGFRDRGRIFGFNQRLILFIAGWHGHPFWFILFITGWHGHPSLVVVLLIVGLQSRVSLVVVLLIVGLQSRVSLGVVLLIVGLQSRVSLVVVLLIVGLQSRVSLLLFHCLKKWLGLLFVIFSVRRLVVHKSP